MKKNISILIELLLDETEFTTIKNLSEKIGVSSRTIHNYLDSKELNAIIYPGYIKKITNRGILLEANTLTKQHIRSKLKEKSFSFYTGLENDFYKIMSLLLTTNKTYSQAKLSEKTNLPQITINHLLDEVFDFANKYECKVRDEKNRIRILGKESQVRKLFHSFLTSFSNYETKLSVSTYPRLTKKTVSILSSLMLETETAKIVDIMQISEKIINTNFCDEDYNFLSVQFAIIIVRIYLGYTISNEEFYNIKNTQEYYYSTIIKNYIEKEFDIALAKSEIDYIAVLLIGTRKQVNFTNSIQEYGMLEKFINLLSMRLNVELSNDFELKQTLMSHLKPAINRMKHGMTNENPLLEQIRINYTEVYMAVITTIEDLEIIENVYFDSNEIGYICLHIVAAINRPSNIKKLKTALICNEGLSFEIFLKNIIESYFKEIHISEIYRENTINLLNPNNYGLILNSSTNIINAKNSVNINTNFTSEDYKKISHFLLSKSSLASNNINEIYNNYLLFFNDKIRDKYEFLQKYCEYLYNNNYVRKGFYESVISRTEISSTYIARGIALPHGAKDFVRQSTIVVVNLSKSIQWDDEEAKIIILVAANDSDSSNYNFLFRKIMRIASNDEDSKQLKECSSLSDLKQILNRV
ncbi:hypothetical protein A4S06_08830 [Erysipelotrichaceae bacterium MTC7]|nr:hypothetical protein A4S06_08830 [Erysipelotrichaceae bacterium MTC7]